MLSDVNSRVKIRVDVEGSPVVVGVIGVVVDISVVAVVVVVFAVVVVVIGVVVRLTRPGISNDRS